MPFLQPACEQTYGPDGNYDVHYADTFALDGADCQSCQELALEAWERMTFGGVPIANRAELRFMSDARWSERIAAVWIDRYLPGITVNDPELFGTYPYATGR